MSDLTDVQRRVTIEALHEKRMETARYLRGSGFQPCHPDCAHCAPRVEMHAELTAGLQQRYDAVIGALTALGAGPCTCGLRDGEHFKGEHK